VGREVLLVASVTKRYPTTLFVLLAACLCGRGQQHRTPSFESLVAAAEKAQAVADYETAAKDYRDALKIRADIPQLWANLGLMQHESGDMSGAMASFRTAIGLNPSLYVPNLFLGIELAHAGNLKEAEPLLAKAERLNRGDAQAPLALGRAYSAEARYAAAALELTHATALSPNLAAAWFELGVARLQEVEGDAYTMSEQGKQSPFAGALYAESLVKQARFGEAASLFESILNKEPQPPCIRSSLGFALLRGHEEAAAETQFAAERSRHPECSLALLGQARLALGAHHMEEAASLMTELWGRDHGFVQTNAAELLGGLPESDPPAIETMLTQLEPAVRAGVAAALNSADAGDREPDNNAAATKRSSARELYAEGAFSECESRLDAEHVPVPAGQLELLAACAFFAGHLERTSDAAAKLRASQPRSLAGIYWSIQANERLALIALAKFQQLAPDSARSHILLGDIYHQLERNDDAEAEYRNALAFGPPDPAALIGLAGACLTNNHVPCAAQAAQTALERNPDDPELNLVMGEALVAQFRYSDAEPYLKKGLGSKPQLVARAHALLGKVFSETGRTEEAIEQLQLGAAGDQDGSIEYMLARLYRKIGDTRHAEDAIAQMKKIKEQRLARGVKRVEDPELSPMEPPSPAPSTP